MTCSIWHLTPIFHVLMIGNQTINLIPNLSFGHLTFSSQLQMENVIPVLICTFPYLSNGILRSNLDHIYYLHMSLNHLGVLGFPLLYLWVFQHENSLLTYSPSYVLDLVISSRLVSRQCESKCGRGVLCDYRCCEWYLL
jgi:hypothetical protein